MPFYATQSLHTKITHSDLPLLFSTGAVVVIIIHNNKLGLLDAFTVYDFALL